MLIEVRPGEGGADAVHFASELISAITAHLRREDISFDVTATARTTSIATPGDGVVARLGGTHRVQRIPRNDTRGRRHTSTATVAVLDDPVLRTAEVRTRIDWFSGSGAGGQHRNRHPLCCRLTDEVSGVTVVSTRHKSREQNEAAARRELDVRLAETAAGVQHAAVQEDRREQVVSERSGKAWTWNDQRNEVVDHASGRKFSMRRALRGVLPV